MHFRRYCTDRKRAYGGKPFSFGNPPTYDGVTAESIVSAAQPKPNRIEVVCAGSEFPGQHFKFVLFRKSSGWLIDNAYSRLGGSGRWTRHHL